MLRLFVFCGWLLVLVLFCIEVYIFDLVDFELVIQVKIDLFVIIDSVYLVYGFCVCFLFD